MTEAKRPNDSLIRWQATTNTQLSYSINLVLTFSVATLGFGVSLALNERFSPQEWQALLFLAALLCLVVSAGLGISATINRLRDFRATTAVTRLRVDPSNKARTEELRTLSRRLGTLTWQLFWWQIGSFSVGIALMIVSIGTSVGRNLFT